MNKLKSFISYIYRLRWIIIIFVSSFFIYKYINLNEDYKNSVTINKALVLENSNIKNKSIEYKLSVEQLEYFNDSITEKLKDVKKELNIKDKELTRLQYLLSEAHKVDTVTFTDTLFKEPSLNIDTIVGDKWYNIKLGLRYPSTIITEPKFISEKYIIASSKKQTINPPKKCWLLRLFQRKHKVVEVEIVEKNPYIENKQSRFIEIIE